MIILMKWRIEVMGLYILTLRPENHCRLSLFNNTILVEMGTSFCHDGSCCQQFVHYICNVKVTVSISVTSPLTAC